MRLHAPAKINLYLRVIGRRPDGYHDLETVFQAVALADTLTFAPAEEGVVALDCDEPSLPTDERNLVVRAAQALRSMSGTRRGVRIRLEKRIPARGGLGGGSSDAATTLVGLRRFWGLDLNDGDLARLAAELGSDVPFFLHGGTALATGRGEVLTPLRDVPPIWLVLVAPPFGVSTPWAFRARRPVEDGPSIDACRAALASGDLAAVAAALRNDLEPGVFAEYPELDRLRRRLLDAGAVGARMTGSGSTLFALARDEAHAFEIAGHVVEPEVTVHVTRSADGRENGPPSPPIMGGVRGKVYHAPPIIGGLGGLPLSDRSPDAQ